MIKQALIQHLKDFIKKNSLDFRVIGNIIYERHHRNRYKPNRRAIDFDEMLYWDSVHSKTSKSILLSDPDIVKKLEEVLLRYYETPHPDSFS